MRPAAGAEEGGGATDASGAGAAVAEGRGSGKGAAGCGEVAGDVPLGSEEQAAATAKGARAESAKKGRFDMAARVLPRARVVAACVA